MTQPLLPPDWTVPQVFRNRLGDRAGRQRAMQSDGHLLLVLHRAPNVGQTSREARILWRDPEGTWKCHDGTDGQAALSQHLSEYDDVLISLDAAEHDAAGAQQYLQVLTRLAPVLRAVRHLHSALQSAREAVTNERALINARDHAYQLERTMDLLMSDARGSLDVATLQQAEEQATSNSAMAKASHRLNVLAALFLPLATISGLFGADLPHPWKQYSAPVSWLDRAFYPFWTMTAVGLGLGIVIAVLIGRNTRQRQ